jgi:hypothetical protein
MFLRRPIHRERLIALSALLVALAAAALLVSPRSALAFPPPGTDELPVSGQVSVSSRIGQETIPLTGTATIQRSAVQLQGGVEVVPAEITAMSLQGDSVTGPITVAESASRASMGELRALQAAPDSYPASSFFDVYATVTAPASPGGSITLHNDTALHMVIGGNLSAWPPFSASYSATPSPCVPLFPSLPKGICITSISFKISGGSAVVGGVTRLADVQAAAEAERAPSRSDTVAGIGISLAGLAAAGLTGWYMRRVLVHRR